MNKSKADLLMQYNAAPWDRKPKCAKCRVKTRLPDNKACFDCKEKRQSRAELERLFREAPLNDKPRCRRCKTNIRLPAWLTCASCKLKDRDYQDQYIRRVVEHYGGRCSCCGEKIREFLEVDHVQNDGAAHRAQIGNRKGANLCRYLVKHGFPKNIRLQLLCANCNKAKEYHGACPHELVRKEKQ
jgi:hypothetical protein